MCDHRKVRVGCADRSWFHGWFTMIRTGRRAAPTCRTLGGRRTPGGVGELDLIDAGHLECTPG